MASVETQKITDELRSSLIKQIMEDKAISKAEATELLSVLEDYQSRLDNVAERIKDEVKALINRETEAACNDYLKQVDAIRQKYRLGV
jgi:hypothetical protein